MCLLTFFPCDVMPDVEALRYGAIANDDGHGFAIVADGTIITHKSFDANETIELFVQTRERYPHGPALFHSRIATDGAIDLNNVHPFNVDGDSRTVIAHNGVLPIRPKKGDARSDTRLLADTLTKRFGSLRNKASRSKLVRWIGPSNKLVVLSVNPRLLGNAFILNEDRGHWSDGIWYSNYSHVRPTYNWQSAYSYRGSGTWAYHEGTYTGWPTVIGDKSRDAWAYDVITCVRCGVLLSEAELQLGYCDACDTCQDCLDYMRNCVCYVPDRYPA